MFHRVHLLSAAVACALSLGAAAAHATTYDFSTAYDSTSSNPQGTTYQAPAASTLPPAVTTPLTLNGATFTTNDPNGYVVGPNAGLYSTLGSSVLSTAGDVASLSIAFASAQTGISFDAATGDFLGLNGSDSVSVSEYNGATLVGTQSITPVVPGTDLYPQGLFSLAAGVAAFTSVTISAADAAGGESLAIADLATTPVPLPATLWMLLGGLGGGLAVARRRR
jgi:hypothetical protein